VNKKLNIFKIRNFLNKPQKKVQMALELVETGDDTALYGQNEKVNKILPARVTTQMLCKDIVRIAWPAFMEFILTQLVSMVDMIMVGRLGPWAISAVGLTGQPKFLLMAAFMSMNVGATALIARYKGEGSYQKTNMVLRQALLITLVLSAITSGIGFIFAEPVIRFMGADDPQTLAGGTIYLQIQMAGFVIFALTTTITAALRGIGNSKTAMIYNTTANIFNVIFNYLLIYGHLGFPRMEVAGASLATVIGQCIAFILASIVILHGNQYLHLRLKDGFKPQWPVIKSIFRIGIPSMVEQLLLRLGHITYTRAVASLGNLAFAAHNISTNILSISFMNGRAFAVSATSLVGQSLGKKRPDMAQAYSRYTRRIGMTISILMGISFWLFRRPLISMYTDDASVLYLGEQILAFVAISQPFQSSQFILSGALRGAGDTRAIAVIIFFTVLLLRPGLAMLAIYVLGWGLQGAWLGFVVDQMIRSLLVLLRFNSGKWKRIKV
jgi:putative MATE family efflux protein